MTHDELCLRAIKWLKGSQGCQLVISESYSSWVSEIPDAIGFKGMTSILVECKASRADFHRDKKKYFRRDGSIGLGLYRYYLTPKGLLNSDEIPNKWGLLEVRGKIIRKIKGAMPFDQLKAAYQEKPLLISAAVYGKAVEISRRKNNELYEKLRYSIEGS